MGSATATERAVFKIFIKGTMQAVWHQITKTDEPQEAFFNNLMHTSGFRPGGTIRMRSADGKYTAVVGEILEFDPPRRFAHTFRFTNLEDPECKVIYDLKEVEGGVEFTMTLEDLPVGTKTAKQMRQGATMITGTLKNMVERGKPSFGTRVLFGMFKLLGPLMTPKKCRSEHWPA